MAIDLKPLTPAEFVIHLGLKTQSDLAKVSTQIATSNQQQDFKGYSEEGNTERLISFKETISNVNNYIKTNSIVGARIDTMSQSIQKIQDIAANFAQLITMSRNAASGSDIPLDVQGRYALQGIEEQLNMKFDGRYLFSGSKTNTPAVSDLTYSNLNASNEVTADYYQGDSAIPTIKVSDEQEVGYGILANEDAFQKLIGAVHLAINGHNDNNDDDTLSAAFDMIDEAITSLTAVRANVISSKTAVDDASATHQAVDLTITENIKDISSTDLVEASTQMSNLQALVQATYLAYSHLSQLKLSNFLT